MSLELVDLYWIELVREQLTMLTEMSRTARELLEMLQENTRAGLKDRIKEKINSSCSRESKVVPTQSSL